MYIFIRHNYTYEYRSKMSPVVFKLLYKKKKEKKKYIIFTTKIVIYINNLLYNAAKRYLFSKRRAHNISVKASAGANYGR